MGFFSRTLPVARCPRRRWALSATHGVGLPLKTAAAVGAQVPLGKGPTGQRRQQRGQGCAVGRAAVWCRRCGWALHVCGLDHRPLLAL